MKLGKVGAQIAMATDAGKTIFGIMMLIHWVLGWFVMSVVVFLRRDFGERYLSWVNILFGMTAIGFFTGIGNVLLSQGHNNLSWAIQLSYYGVVGLSVFHRVMIWRRNRKGELWHSYNPGTSLLQIPGLSEEAVAKWIEPAVLFFLSYLAGKLNDGPLHTWLLIGSFALLVHEQVSYHMQRQQFLDMRDALIESKNWSAVMSGKPPAQTHGYMIAHTNLEMLQQDPELQDAFTRLPEEMRAIMDREAA